MIEKVVVFMALVGVGGGEETGAAGVDRDERCAVLQDRGKVEQGERLDAVEFHPASADNDT